MSPQLFATTIHLAGFVTGLALYGMLLVMTLRHGAAGDVRGLSGPGDRQRLRTVWPVSVAVLGLTWNVSALLFYSAGYIGLARINAWVGATGFAALCFLPAVVVHSTIRELQSARWSGLAVVAYAVSVTGAAMQFWSAGAGVVPSAPGLRVMTIGYAAIVALLAVLAIRTHQSWQRSLSIVALAAFSVSALHLSAPESAAPSWPVELIGHHASLPLILVILYQDYRFAFADLFLRRALAFVALVALAVTLHRVAFVNASASVENVESTAKHITFWVLTALAYPPIQRITGRFVDRIVLARTDYARVRENLAEQLQKSDDVGDLLNIAARSIETALSARTVDVIADTASDPVAITSNNALRVLRIPVADRPGFALSIAPLRGGRRLLSDDQLLLEWIATSLARRIDAVRVTNERHQQSLRETEMLRLTTEAELRALQAQLNPHFLFNALNTIAYLLQSAPERALDTLYRLTHVLRGVLRRSSGSFVTLHDEIELVESYLAIEQARFEERLTVHIDVPESIRMAMIPPLLLQPLVENAIKHGIAPLARGGSIAISASINRNASPPTLQLEVHDSGPGIQHAPRETGTGVGLTNIRERLERHYQSAAALRISNADNGGARACITIPYSIS